MVLHHGRNRFKNLDDRLTELLLILIPLEDTLKHTLGVTVHSLCSLVVVWPFDCETPKRVTLDTAIRCDNSRALSPKKGVFWPLRTILMAELPYLVVP
jgi:hypothetical protein